MFHTFNSTDAGTLGKTWVRDLVIKFVGTAQRAKPDHWRGISTETDQEGQADGL